MGGHRGRGDVDGVELRPGMGGAVLDGYGIEPDETRLAYYRDLWNAT